MWTMEVDSSCGSCGSANHSLERNVPRAMSSDVGMGSAMGGEPQRGSSGSSKASSKKGKERMVPTAENYAGPSLSRRGLEKPEDLTRQDYVNMLGDDVFKAFVRRREAALRAAAGWSHFAQFTNAVVKKDLKRSKYSGF